MSDFFYFEIANNYTKILETYMVYKLLLNHILTEKWPD